MKLLRAISPALPAGNWADALRGGVGAAAGLGLTACVLSWTSAARGDALHFPLLIAPFGASALLIFVVPNSPLAQPWSVMVGNLLSAVVALLVISLALPPIITDMLSVGLAILAMAFARALHPPSGAVALFTALSAPNDPLLYLWSPIFLGSLCLIAFGVLWARMTGRVYPFRQPPEVSAHGTADPSPDRRHLPSPDAMAELLTRLRLDANIGVEDVTRLFTAAEVDAASRPLGTLAAQDLMSRDLVTVAKDTPLPVLAESFQRHGFQSLPVVGDAGFIGLVSNEVWIGTPNPSQTAGDLAQPCITVPPEASAGELAHILASNRQQAIPVLDDGRLVGIVTRSDLIALLARGFAR